MTRDSNEFEINGVTFNLQKAGTAKVSVEKDTDAVYNSIKEFVDQYNSTMRLLNTRLSEEKVENASSNAMKSRGLLRGDSTVSSIRSDLRQTVTDSVSGLVNIFDSLMEVGISTSGDDFGKSGLLEIDEDKLKDSLENNMDAVRKLFFDDSDADDKVDDGEKGVAAKLYNKLQSYVSSSTTSINGRSFKVGIIPMRLDSMDKQIDNYDDQIDDFEDKLELVETRLWREFTALETALSKLNSQGSWLSGQLASLPTS